MRIFIFINVLDHCRNNIRNRYGARRESPGDVCCGDQLQGEADEGFRLRCHCSAFPRHFDAQRRRCDRRPERPAGPGRRHDAAREAPDGGAAAKALPADPRADAGDRRPVDISPQDRGDAAGLEVPRREPAVGRFGLVLCTQRESRELLFEMSSITQIFHTFLKLHEEDAQLSLAHVLTRWLVSKDRLSKLADADFLRPFFNSSIISSIRVRQGCLQVVIAAAKLGFVEEFCIIARHITELMRVPELASLSIFASSELSKYQQCSVLFRNEQLVMFFNDLLNYPEYKQAAGFFLDHVHLD